MIITAFVNPCYGDDATAELNNRARPWRTHPPALAALQAARESQAAEPGGVRDVFNMIETHKPLPVLESPPAQ